MGQQYFTRARIRELEAQVAELRECVEYYASSKNWRRHSHMANIITSKEDVHGSYIARFGGWIATKCLLSIDKVTATNSTESCSK